MATIHTKSELNDAMKRGDSTIEIEGDLANRIIRIKATGAVAWAVAVGAIGIVVYSVVSAPVTTVATGGADVPAKGFASGIAGGAAVTVLGFEATAAAISLAISAGGIGILTRLRSDYKIVESRDRLVVLQKV
jgi:hypothetical protein